MENEKRKAGHVCSYKGCKSKSYDGGKRFYRCPQDVERARSWLIACGRKDLLDKVATLHNSYRICDAHFPPWMFQRGKRLLLRKDAVPIKLSPDSDTDEPVPSSSGLSRISNTTNTSTSEIPHTGSILRHILESDACSSFDKAETATSSIQTSVTPTVNKASKEKLKEINTTFRLEYIKLKKQNRELLFRCSNLKKRLAKEQEKTSTLEQYKTFTYAVCRSKEVAELVNIHQTSQSIKSGEERKYSNDYKLKCLSLYFSAPKVYESLLTKLFCLPETQMLRKFLRSINISPGLEVPNLFKTLKMKVDNFNEIDKYCVLCVDEMRIKPNCFFNISADHIIGIEDPGNGNRVFKPTRTATVLLARGIFSDWEQPLSYFFYNNTCPAIELLHIIFDAIQKLRDIGLNVIVVVSDMSSNNIQVKSLLQITPELPYFTFEDQKIFFMFDTPNLLKAMRNKLMKYDFLVFNEIISWKYIEQFYNIDKGLVTGSAPKLTDSHIFPGNLEKMQVKYASQVFSATVSSALNASVEVGTLSKNAQTTADFIDTVDKLFDLLNSSNTSGCKQYNLAFMGFDFQVNFFNEILSLFENFKVVNNLNQDITSKMKFITGFRITINSVLSLWSFMESNKISSVFTRRLNLDPLENLFCVIRQQNKNCVNPTAIQFQRSFRKICCSKLFNSGLENCKNDTNNLFLTVSDIIKEDTSLPTIIDPPLSQKLNIPNIDTSYQKDTLLKINFVRYLANFLIEKCLTVHSCDTCETYSKNYQNLDETTLYSYYKAYTNADLDLLGNLSHNDFIELISLLETLFQTNFENLATQKNLIKTFESICKPVKFLHPCELFPFRYLIRLFGRVRLFHTLKYINRNFKNVKDKKVIVWKNN